MNETFTTSNSTVRNLPAGTLLRVKGSGIVEILPEGHAAGKQTLTAADLEPGTAICIPSKKRTGVVVRAGRGLYDAVDDQHVLYLSDDEDVVRVADVSDVEVL